MDDEDCGWDFNDACDLQDEVACGSAFEEPPAEDFADFDLFEPAAGGEILLPVKESEGAALSASPKQGSDTRERLDEQTISRSSDDPAPELAPEEPPRKRRLLKKQPCDVFTRPTSDEPDASLPPSPEPGGHAFSDLILKLTEQGKTSWPGPKAWFGLQAKRRKDMVAEAVRKYWVSEERIQGLKKMAKSAANHGDHESATMDTKVTILRAKWGKLPLTTKQLIWEKWLASVIVPEYVQSE